MQRYMLWLESRETHLVVEEMNVSGWRTTDVGVARFSTIGTDGLRGAYDLNVQAGAERLEMADDELLIRRWS